MERTLERDDLVLRFPALLAAELARKLERAFVRLAARVAEKDTIRTAQLGKTLRQLLCRIRADQVRCMNKARVERGRDDGLELRIAVTKRIHTDATREVEQLTAVFRDEVRAAAAHDHRLHRPVNGQQSCSHLLFSCGQE